MSGQEFESAPSRALWGLPLIAGTALATLVFGLSLSLIMATAASGDGYRGFEVYAKYDLSPLFREGQGPAVRPFTFGISLSGAM